MLLCTDKAIEAAHATADETDSSAGATETFRKVTVELKREFARHVSFTDKAKKKSCAKACLEAYLHNKVFRKVQMLLHYADGQAVVVASAASSYATSAVCTAMEFSKVAAWRSLPSSPSYLHNTDSRMC